MTRSPLLPASVPRLLATAVALLLAAVLTACAGLPVSGPVKLGRPVAEADEDPVVFFNPDDPTTGMTPQQIVEGFIAAATGPRDDWGVAKLFLTEQFRDEWDPTAGVTVYVPGLRAVSEPEEGRVDVEVSPEAAVDASGAYTVVDGPPLTLEYRLVQEDGEWRIADAPDGIVLDRIRFASVFRSYALMYFDPTWTYLVPDQRWFAVENAPTRITQALVAGGPSPWLADSVQSAFTEAAGLVGPSVPVRSQVAEVSLRVAARDLEQLTLDRMQAQLAESLATAGVRSVEMLVDGEPLTATAVPVRSTRVEPRALVLVDRAFGFLSGGTEIDPLAAFSVGLSEMTPDAIEVDAERQAAAVRSESGDVRLVRSDGTWTTLDTRAGLVEPTGDPRGYVYSVPAGDPAALVAFDSDGVAHDVADAWPGATQVFALRVSRDGTRVAAVVRDGMEPTVMIAGIVRDDSGVPVRLSEPQVLGLLDGDGLDLTWLDGGTLAVLAEADGQRVVREQPVGGPAASTRAPEGAVAISGGNESGSVRLLDVEGTLFGQRGATWSPVASEVSVLAVQQGSPR